MDREILHNVKNVRLIEDYQDESRNYSAGEKGEVRGFDDSLVVVAIEKKGNIAVPPQLLEPVGN